MLLKMLIVPVLQKTTPDLLYSFPLLILSACIWTSADVWEGVKFYLFIYGCFTWVLMKLLFCGHRIQDTWTEGAEKIEEFGEHTLYATSDTDPWLRGLASYVLTVGFNIHVTHHLFPTADHKMLPQLDEIVE